MHRKIFSLFGIFEFPETGLIMAHGTIRAVTLKTLIPLIMKHFGCDENNAFKIFYESHIGKCYADDSTGLYGQSAAYMFSLLCQELSLSDY